VSYHRAIDYAWLAVMVIWLIAAANRKRAVRIYRGRSRVFQVIILIVAFFLVFDSDLAIGFLGWRLVPATPNVQILGLAITLAGLGFALWARFFLGRNWSGEVTVKKDHQLIRGGPYTIVRHPIYSGFLLGLLGTAVAFGELRGFIGLVLAAIGWRLKSLVEERFMTEQFGDEYTTYKQDVKALVPFIW
jgi:protein-S-isoprenylcysteine O-methyltransferase Ste14